MTFEKWLGNKRLGSMELEFSREAYNAGYDAYANELCEKYGQTRQQAGGGCIHCITEDCKDRVRKAQANAKPEIAIAEAYRCGAESRDAEIAELVGALEEVNKRCAISSLGRSIVTAALAKVRKP